MLTPSTTEVKPLGHADSKRATPQVASHATNAGLDGLRAFAILSVLAVHAGVPGAAAGWLGVDLFFVLSGFLITTLLVKEQHRNGKISLRNFWLRRFLRLMPAYWVYASFITIALLVVGWGSRQEHGGYTPLTYVASIWLYFINLVPQGGIWEYQQFSLHLWSLAVEEQFYFVWPLVCALLIGSNRLEAFTWFSLAMLFVRRSLCDDADLLPLLSTRGIAIIFGCAAALRLANGGPALRAWVARPVVAWVSVVGIVLGAGLATTLEGLKLASEPQLHRYLVPFLIVLFGLFSAHLWQAPDGRVGRSLSARPLVYIGKISYGLYLYHMLAHFLTWHVLLADIEHWNRWLKFGVRWCVFCGLTLAFAWVSYTFMEKRLLDLKARFR